MLALMGFAGAVLVAVTTFAPIIEITIGGGGNATAEFDPSLTGYDRHSVALLLLGALAGVLHLGAVRGARPATLAVAACGVAVLLIAVLGDAPDLDQAGRVAELYEDTSAQAGIGFFLETLGGALLAVAGVGLLLLGGGQAAIAGRRSPGGPAVAAEDSAELASVQDVPARATVEPGAPAVRGAAEPTEDVPDPPQIDDEVDAPAARAGSGTPPRASAGRRLGGGLAAGAAKARRAREDQSRRRAQRAEAERAREAARAERAAQAAEREEQAAAVARARDAEEAVARGAAAREQADRERAAAEREAAAREQAERERSAGQAPEDGPAPPDAPPAGGTLSFDERLRQARERARRMRGGR
ncbi:hypothetical protein GKE82_08455 [Conexibacter sp. W3-3-2]|uniref:hypothetical protein n=1 Tax=Conexibacter sp. W3-3-2 TaxID=2675227 RepID=UPI0012B7C425|nr:hypothetical protein [Conexibacter sp. W3-3-2]MTD44326.1 hypothetical protein [Conexibacter sp. W3-3-2]